MGQTAKFGIVTSVDDAALAKLVKNLMSLPEITKLITQAWDAVAPKVEVATRKIQTTVEDGEKKITGAKQQSAERQKQLLTEQVNAEETAAKRRIETEERAAKLTKSVENMTTTALVDDIFKLQQRRSAADTARKAAVAEGAKFEVAEQKKILASLDEEIATLKKVSIQRKEVQKEGAGTKIGQLGTGREANEGSHKGSVSVGEMAGIGAGIALFEGIADKAEKASEAESHLRAATGATGEALKEEAEDAENLGHQYKIGGDVGKEAMAKVGAFSHATGDTLKKQTEDAIILAQKYDISVESAAKLLGKSSDQEVLGNLKKVGINLDANATAEERAAAVHKAAMDSKAGVDAANDTATRNSKEIITEFEEKVSQTAATFLNILNPALKIILPILPEIAIAIGIVTVAMNAQSIAAKAQAIYQGALTVATTAQTVATWLLNAAMAVNPFVWIGLAIVALIVIVVLLVKHWNEVVAVTKKVFSAIMDAGGAVLNFLGITSKAEAATRKHTDSLVENKKALEDTKKALDDNADALEAYEKKLKESSDENLKNERLGVDQIRFLQSRLADPSVQGAVRAAFQKSLTETIAYTKKIVAIQEAGEKAQHDATVAAGVAVDEDKKKGKDTAYQKEKERVEKEYAEARTALETKQIQEHESEWNAKAQILKLERDHAKKKLDVEEEFKKDSSKGKLELLKANDAIEKNYRNGEQQDSMLAAKEASDKETEEQQKNLAEQNAIVAKNNDEQFESDKKFYEEQKRLEEEHLAYILGPLSNAFHQFSGIIDQTMSKSIDVMMGHKTIFGQLVGQVIQGYAQMGIAAVQHASVSEIADNASAAAKWTATAATAVYKAFESLPFPLDIAAALASVAAVVGIASQAKHIGGHAMGVHDSPGGLFMHGENGPELYYEKPGSSVIPNHELPGLLGGHQDFAPLLHAVNRQNALMQQNNDLTAAIHNNSKPGYGSSQSLYNLTRGQNQANKTVNRRQVK